MTRRRALQLGAVAGVSTLFAGPAALASAASSTPRYLRRATYVALRGQRLRVDGRALRLVGVEDLAGVSADSALAGHPEAFVLTLVGQPDGRTGGIRRVEHPQFGSASLFVTPVESAVGGRQVYEIVVDRSVGAPKDPPAAPAVAQDASARPGSPEAAATEAEAATRALVAEGRRLQPRQHKLARAKRAAKRRKAAKRRTAVGKRRAVRQRPVSRRKRAARRPRQRVRG